MPIYEYKCPNCGWEKEVLVLGEEEVPSCISCGISMKRKISCFSYKADRTAERERNIMKLASDYLKDGKVQDAARFYEKGFGVRQNRQYKEGIRSIKQDSI